VTDVCTVKASQTDRAQNNKQQSYAGDNTALSSETTHRGMAETVKNKSEAALLFVSSSGAEA
jgi:hypothetical protein